jgi:hypothetical protein
MVGGFENDREKIRSIQPSSVNAEDGMGPAFATLSDGAILLFGHHPIRTVSR